MLLNILCGIYYIPPSTAEKDRQGFEEKISASSVTLDNLHDHLKSLFSRLESSEEAVRNRMSY